MGETRVDLLHLLEDLRDAYPGSLEETILTEIVANALDSRATELHFKINPAESALVVADNGSGMQRRELTRYHDIAATTKVRGQGIGFAGVGIKLGLLACREVLTETRRGTSHVASRWHLASRHRAPWKWTPPPGLLSGRGTAVRLVPNHALSPVVDAGFVEQVIRDHFAPLFDPRFGPLLAEHGRPAIAFFINGQMLERDAADHVDHAPIAVRLPRKRKPAAVGYLARHADARAEAEQGVAISTFGKVIKRGWDWLGVTPASPNAYSGLVEVPALAACLTLNKGDFIRTGQRGALYLGYRKAIQEVVTRQLQEWGDRRLPEEPKPKLPGLTRDLERVLQTLADDFPLLSSLVERRATGQKHLPMSPVGDPGRGDDVIAAPLSPQASSERVSEEPAARPGDDEQHPWPETPPREPPAMSPEALDALLGGPRRRRPLRYGLDIRFEPRRDDPQLARLVDSTVWINEAHPACQRAQASRALGYHVALSVAMALAPLAVPASDAHTFMTAFLARWGEAMDHRTAPRRRRRKG
ncbi:MAG: hypothetical protein GEU99_25860 [Luteitalea sp.]|nr:hypothetical protein [Luteitalea sp.]